MGYRCPDVITPRQIEILDLYSKGFHDKLIALKLGISYQTVKNHIERLYERTGTRNRVQAFRVAVEKGLIQVT